VDGWKGGRMKILVRRKRMTKIKVVGSCADEESRMLGSE
jgi:hypothetical protein